MPKGKRSDPDYEGWIIRTLDKPENLRYTRTNAGWLRYAAKMIEPRQGYKLTPSQKQKIGELRDRARAIPGIFGVRDEYPARFRDKGGRFTKDRSQAVKIENIQRFREIGTGRYVNPGAVRSDIAAYIQRYRRPAKQDGN